VSEGIDPYKGTNSWRILRSGSHWNLFVGNREYRHAASFVSDLTPKGSPNIISNSPGGIFASINEIESAPIDDTRMSEADVLLVLDSIGAKTFDVVGLYSMLDYEQDDAYARLGGVYRIALLPSVDGYYVYYMGGARENVSGWSAGRLKAMLKTTAFPALFDVEWCDAEGKWMLHDIQAEHDALAKTLTVKFPYQGASIRFRKE
ncbi:MAG: hypothetical protein K2H72_06080, partial [Muribaculaceae bacterium]|nr:hypothetical protein [Muribaculaceae bacterium]